VKRSVASLKPEPVTSDPGRAKRKQIVAAQRVAAMGAPRTAAEKLARAKRRRRKAAEAQGRVMTPEGLSPKFKARLQAAEKAAASDPEARAMVAKARLAKRIEVAKREAGISDKPIPTRFMGAQSAVELERSSMAAPLPPRMSDVRSGAAVAPKKKRAS
jgi:hypothetical protein